LMNADRPPEKRPWLWWVLALMAVIAVILGARYGPRLASLAGRTPTPTTPIRVTTPDPYREARLKMVESQMRLRDISDEDVLKAMENVPRHEFVPPEYVNQAHADHPLPIGYGQTISQPYIVALMTQLLQIEQSDKVLEIGTGSGYQAAILGELTDEVYTVEIIQELAETAREQLESLGYTNVHVRHGDGYYGWAEHAPYDCIIGPPGDPSGASWRIPDPLAHRAQGR